jgi:hypothetical protein
MFRIAPPILSAALVVCAFATRAAAQEASPLLPSVAVSIAAAELELVAQPSADRFAAPRPRRPEALLPLYISFGALQALDVHSTIGALDRGAVEANPLIKPFAGGTAGLLAIKAAGTAGVFYTTEQLWKKNPTAAVLFMVAANSAMAFVVQNNYRTAR